MFHGGPLAGVLAVVSFTVTWCSSNSYLARTLTAITTAVSVGKGTNDLVRLITKRGSPKDAKVKTSEVVTLTVVKTTISVVKSNEDIVVITRRRSEKEEEDDKDES